MLTSAISVPRQATETPLLFVHNWRMLNPSYVPRVIGARARLASSHYVNRLEPSQAKKESLTPYHRVLTLGFSRGSIDVSDFWQELCYLN